MRRIHFVPVVILMLSALMFAHSQSPAPTRSKPKGKVLVDRLPDGLQGVQLDRKVGALKLKPGYGFVKQTNGSVGVAARMASGGFGTIIFAGSCNCIPPKGQTAKGECVARVVEEALQCDKGSCNGECKLAVTIGSKTTGLILY
jgi:hypothetical protein